MFTAAMLALSLGTAIYKGIKGRKQKKEAQALEDEYPRPDYEVSGALQEAMGLSKERAMRSGVDGEGAIRAAMGEASAKGYGRLQETGGSAADVLFGGTQVAMGEQRGEMQLGLMGAQAENQRMSEHLAFLPQYGQAQDKKWDINEYQPYAQAMAKAAQLREAGEQNQYSAISDVGSAALGMGYANMTGAIDAGSWFPGGGGGGAPSGGGGTSNLMAPSNMFPASGGFNPSPPTDFETALTQGSMQQNYKFANRETPKLEIPNWFSNQ